MASFAEIHKNTVVDTFSSVSTNFKDSQQDNKNQSDSLGLLQTEFRRYMQNKILLECLLSCSNDLEPSLNDKVTLIINSVKLQQYLKLANHNLLGIQSNFQELTYQEGENLKLVMKKKLCEKRLTFFDEFKKITKKDLDQVVGVMKPNESIYDWTLTQQDETIISYKQKLVIEQNQFMNKYTQRSNLWAEILDLRLKKIPNLCVQANRGCKVKIESNYLKSKLAEYKTKLDIFMEVPKAIEAYAELMKDIKQQQEECEWTIENLKQDKAKYEDVNGCEYDEILKQYLLYLNSINKLKKMYAIVKD